MEFIADIAQMRVAAKHATTSLRLLANEDRLLLLCQLTHGERSVGELEQALDIRQPTLSQQLALLRNQGLVTARREGKRMFYAVTDAKVLEVLSLLYKLYCLPDDAADHAATEQQGATRNDSC